MLLEIQDGTVSRGGHPVLTNFDFYIRGTEKIAIVGRNGAGKTTLLNVLAEKLPLDRDDKSTGHGLVKARDLSVAYLAQGTNLPQNVTLGEYLSLASDSHSVCGGSEFSSVLSILEFSQESYKKSLSEFSGGEKKRIELVHLLLERPDVLLLDEPTNHLDISSINWLENILKSYEGSVVIVSHDRYFMDQVCDVTWEVADGRLTRYAGNYSAYRTERAKKLERQWKAYEAQQEEIKRLEDTIEKWKHKPNKASFARSRKKMLERMERISKPPQDEALMHREEITPQHQCAKWIYRADKLQIGYEKDHPIQEITCRVRRGSKIGIIGENGSGKTTFLKTIAGELPILKGEGLLGNGVEYQYFHQMSAEIDSDETVMDYFHNRFPSMMEKDVRNTLAGYLFYGTDMGKTVRKLSGGEKARLVLATMLESRPNLLILDEPTNNMDIPARETIEAILKMYKGTILTVSHDRYFLSEVCDSLLIFEKKTEEPVVKFYPFDYRHYMDRLSKLEAGEDLSLIRSAEEQKMIEEFRAVPKREHHRLREYSTEEQNRDWRYELNRERREDAEERVRMLEDADEHIMTLEEYMNAPDEDESVQDEKQAAEDAWTDELLDWYDIYLETHRDEEIMDA